MDHILLLGAHALNTEHGALPLILVLVPRKYDILASTIGHSQTTGLTINTLNGMNGQARNSFLTVAAARALEAPEGPHAGQQLLVHVTKRHPSTPSISAGMAPHPRVERNIGDREVSTSPPTRDREFFLDGFTAENDNKQEKSDAKVGAMERSSPKNSSHFETVRIVPDHSSARAWASDGLVKLSATGGEGGSLSVKVSMSKKRPLPVVGVEEDHEQGQAGEETWSRAEFMTGTRSASQQAAIELGVQMAWGIKFAAGRVHSMIRCSEQEVAVYTELANQFLAGIDGEEEEQPSQQLTETGRVCCSQPGCSKQAQAKGKCIAHGGVRECTYPDCTAISRWRGRCAAHGGRHICSEENCEKLVRTHGKCEEHGGGGNKKNCSVPGCTKRYQSRGLCATHGGSVLCKTEGCGKKALSKGLCRVHGGGTLCKTEGCTKIGSVRGYCHRHGAEHGVIKRKGTCKVDGCPKYRLNGGYCTKHAKERGIAVGRKCQTEGCEKSAQVGGHCISHGGGARCTHPECTKLAISKGLCSTHGGRITCKAEGCMKWGLSKGAMKGYCIEHGGGQRCKHPGCTKSVQFKGLCCTHGGWNTCKADGCSKRANAKGFCTSHRDTESIDES